MPAPSRIFLFIHDGFYCAHTGAGIQNAEYIKALQIRFPQSQLYVCPIFTDKNNPDFQPDWHASITRQLRHGETFVVPIDNGTGGMERYGNPSIWARNALAAFNVVSDNMSRTDTNLVISVDSPFIELLPLLNNADGIVHLHVPHSTAKIHDPLNVNRITQEHDAMVSLSPNTFIGTIGSYMAAHLHNDYGIPRSKLIELHNGRVGLYETKVGAKEYSQFNKNWGISPFEKLIVAYGRAVEYKGFHLLIQAAQELGTGYHLLINATSVTSNDYIVYLQGLAQKSKVRCTVNFKFDARLPVVLRQHPQTIAIVVPSLHEPYGLIPSEVMLDRHSTCPVIVADTEGLSSQVVDTVTGFKFVPGNTDSLRSALMKCLAMNEDERAVMLLNAQSSCIERCNMVNNIAAAISQISDS